jgi:hypothetical protein
MDTEQAKCFSSTTFGEGRTGIGQMVEFTCLSDVKEQVVEFLRTNICRIDIPTTGRVNVAHGGYGQYTRYDIKQHKYAGGGSGFIEALEIKNPPDSRWGIVINERVFGGNPSRSVFSEWETLENACDAFEGNWSSRHTAENFPKLSGFKRLVVCGLLTPWFYAVGDEQLVGDYAFPEGLQDDSVYRFGRQFVVFDGDGIPVVKTCMGTRFIRQKRDYHPYDEYQYRLVYWDDGSVWDENRNGCSPRPLEEGELWIAEAVQQFCQLLAGKNTEFTINFTDGNKFVGRLVRAKRRVPCAEGDYFVVVHLKGKKKPLQGWTGPFKPTPKTPDIVQYVIQRYAKGGQEVERVDVKECNTEKGGKKWVGVFFNPSKQTT